MKTIQDVRTWLHALRNQGRLWHMDTPAAEVIWPDGREQSPAQVAVLGEMQEQARAVCEAAGVDIFELYPGESYDAREYAEQAAAAYHEAGQAVLKQMIDTHALKYGAAAASLLRHVLTEGHGLGGE